jgi:gamma-glutamyltranspeptidase
VSPSHAYPASAVTVSATFGWRKRELRPFTTAPLAATPERFVKSGIAIEGPLSTSTLGGLSGLYAMHGAHGGLPWSELAKPAIDLARDGFLATHAYRHYAGFGLDKLRADPISCIVYLD